MTRLIAAQHAGSDGFYHAGVEIRLDPGALTYWRSPGGAGAPPSFSFEGSDNVADVSVLYPAPLRLDESGTEVFGYQGAVTFPLHVTPKDDSRPANLALTLRYAVCEKLCLPAKATASLSLPPLKKAPAAPVRAASDGPADADPERAAIAAAEAKVPVRLAAGARDGKIRIERIAGSQPRSWRLTVLNGQPQDLFAEAPDGWYYETQASDRPNEFLIVETDKPAANAGAPPSIVLTLTEPGQNYEFPVELDPNSAGP